MVLHQAWSLVLVSLGVAFLPAIARMVRLPAVVLEIVFGIIIGQSLLNFKFTGEWMPFLAELGFLILMFQAGMEINFAALSKQRPGQLILHLIIFLATFGLSWLAAILLGFGLFTGLIFSTTSLGLVLPILKETGIQKSAEGQSTLVIATLSDFLTLFGITFFVLWHEYGFGWHFLKPIPLFVGFAILLKIMRLFSWWYPDKVSRMFVAEDVQELGVRFSLALLFLFVAISEFVHLEPVLGAFMGGAILSIIYKHKINLELKLSALGSGFLIPVFFIHVGMQFNIGNILNAEQLILVLQLFLCAVIVKVLPSILLIFNGISFSRSIKIGLLLSSRLSLIIVAATIGTEMKFITPEMKDAIILLALITCLLGPTSFKVLYKKEKDEKDKGDIENIKKDPFTTGWMQ